jgi:hypothetical protein
VLERLGDLGLNRLQRHRISLAKDAGVAKPARAIE